MHATIQVNILGGGAGSVVDMEDCYSCLVKDIFGRAFRYTYTHVRVRWTFPVYVFGFSCLGVGRK